MIEGKETKDNLRRAYIRDGETSHDLLLRLKTEVYPQPHDDNSKSIKFVCKLKERAGPRIKLDLLLALGCVCLGVTINKIM